MKVIYYADDGTEFNNESACLEYERFHNEETERRLSEIHAFNEQGKKIKLGDNLQDYNMEDMIRDTVCIMFDTREAWDFFNKQQDYYGYDCIKYTALYRDEELYIYEDRFESWIPAKSSMEYYQKMLEKFMERK